ncbi:hypothetical protein [Neobacillus citreus]|uniref:Uncharacterized protein n=1 Tax=Neobacillus citreus TaxID=2833578 RepID=A0A942YE65_9BACI|nr:hypothetical protein [Neobacillus citreus]MCH6266985.1 hypothetical protein [Neobacillus citreus]
MEDTSKKIDWIRSLPDYEKDKLKKILSDLNEIMETDPKGFKQIDSKMQSFTEGH